LPHQTVGIDPLHRKQPTPEHLPGPILGLSRHNPPDARPGPGHNPPDARPGPGHNLPDGP
jgi:hypothetical protein